MSVLVPSESSLKQFQGIPSQHMRNLFGYLVGQHWPNRASSRANIGGANFHISQEAIQVARQRIRDLFINLTIRSLISIPAAT